MSDSTISETVTGPATAVPTPTTSDPEPDVAIGVDSSAEPAPDVKETKETKEPQILSSEELQLRAVIAGAPEWFDFVRGMIQAFQFNPKLSEFKFDKYVMMTNLVFYGYSGLPTYNLKKLLNLDWNQSTALTKNAVPISYFHKCNETDPKDIQATWDLRSEIRSNAQTRIADRDTKLTVMNCFHETDKLDMTWIMPAKIRNKIYRKQKRSKADMNKPGWVANVIGGVDAKTCTVLMKLTGGNFFQIFNMPKKEVKRKVPHPTDPKATVEETVYMVNDDWVQRECAKNVGAFVAAFIAPEPFIVFNIKVEDSKLIGDMKVVTRLSNEVLQTPEEKREEAVRKKKEEELERKEREKELQDQEKEKEKDKEKDKEKPPGPECTTAAPESEPVVVSALET